MREWRGGPRVAIERLAASLVSSPALSRVTGHLADLRLPPFAIRPLLRLYVRAFGVDLGEAAEPLESFPTFNAFFTRRLREGARPIAGGEGVVVSPSDSRLSVIGPVPPDGRLEQVKGLAIRPWEPAQFTALRRRNGGSIAEKERQWAKT